MQRTRTAALLTLIAGVPAALAADPTLAVGRCDVRFTAPAGEGDPGTGSVRLRGEVPAGPDLHGFDPASDGIAVTLGPSPLLDSPAGDGALDARRARDGTWTLRHRVDGGPRLRLVLDPDRRRIDLAASDAELAKLRAAGPSGVALSLRIGDLDLAATLDFREASARRWEFRDGGGDGSVRFEVVSSGTHSGVGEFRTVTVTTPAAWDELWEEISPGTEPPRVNFRAESVLGVLLGVRPTSGYGVRILSVAATGESSLAVAWEESAPGDDCIVLQALTTPYVLVRVPVPGATATFEGSRVVVHCEAR